MTSNEIKVYDIIDKKAGSNMFLQGLSGVLGFPFTMLADVGVFFTHYEPMLTAIRGVYGLGKAEEGSVKTILMGCKTEIIADLILDKAIGNLPIIGIPANVVCAKAMTWRLGILFGKILTCTVLVNMLLYKAP